MQYDNKKYQQARNLNLKVTLGFSQKIRDNIQHFFMQIIKISCKFRFILLNFSLNIKEIRSFGGKLIYLIQVCCNIY